MCLRPANGRATKEGGRGTGWATQGAGRKVAQEAIQNLAQEAA